MCLRNIKTYLSLFSAAWLWACAPGASAATQELTAMFTPDPQNPMNNKFINTTPQSGVCPGHMPERCNAWGIFSIRTTDIVFRSSGPMLFNPGVPSDPRSGVMFKVPSEWRRIDVVSETGEQQVVEVRIAGIGGWIRVDRPASYHAWGPRTWQYAPSPCQSTGFLTGTGQSVLWFWLVPEGIGACNLVHTMEIPGLAYGTFEYAYEIRTPNPLTMGNGVYRGTLAYSVGPNKDFDYGDIMIPNDDSLVFNFTLDVRHIFKIEIPPGGHTVELVPQGGWQAWLQHGRRPTRLFRDQTFNIWTSGRFNMQMECQFQSGNTCAIQSDSGHAVPLDVSVSLPGGIADASGQRVNRVPLLLDGSTTELFAPTHYIDRRPGTLHFEVKRQAVEDMLTRDASTYSGTVTVVWNSQI
ncbi:hypothetical protein [Pseudomonas synxantha]|uniref:hypothetical protein n=1 Tax=Pseudomonas synxantha TaxID=47883 RepID=UPI002793F372|nr:hypothetical protein [Pseudomonas synxantha]